MERWDEKSLSKQSEHTAGHLTSAVHIPDVSPNDSAESEICKFRSMVARRWRLMAAAIVIVLVTGAIYTFTRTPVYQSSAEVLILTSPNEVLRADKDVPVLRELQALAQSRSVDTQVELISSPNMIEEAFRLLGPGLQGIGFKQNKIHSWAYQVYAKRNTDVVAITARSYSAVAAAALANSIANTYLVRSAENNELATRQARMIVEDRLHRVQRDLEKANYRFAELKQSSGLFSLDAQLTSTAENMARLSADLEKANADYAAARNEASALRSRLSKTSEDVLAGATVVRNPRYDEALSSIDALDRQKSQLLEEYSPDSDEIREIEEKIARERDRLKSIPESVVESKTRGRNPSHDDLQSRYAVQAAAASAASARVAALRSELRTMRSANRKLPSQEGQINEQRLHVDSIEADYKSLSEKHKELLLREQAAAPNGMLISEATVSDVPVYPNKMNNLLLFLLLGVVLALAAAVIAEWLDLRVHDQFATEQMSRLTTLSMIPEISRKPPLLLGSGDRDPVLLESFRILRNNVRLAALEQRMKLIAVTSPGRGDGKSTTSLNLAITTAMEGRNVLLVDADIRRPSIHNLLRIPGDRGLTSILSGAERLEKVIVPTEIDHLFCLPAGTACPNPPEMLGLPSCRELFRSLGELYDVVIIDCPPGAGLSDVQIISSMVDGMLLVVSMNKTLRPHLIITIRALQQAGAPLAGLVLNRANVKYQGAGYYDCCTSITPASKEPVPRRNRRQVKT